MSTSARLRWITATRAHLDAELEGASRSSGALGVEIGSDWPPELFDHDALRWYRDHMLADPLFEEGPPSRGAVEIGYRVLRRFRGRGIATETVSTLVVEAAARGVSTIVAYTLPAQHASIRALEKCGFGYAGDREEERLLVVRFERCVAGG